MKQLQSLNIDRETPTLVAPFQGVIYTTDYEQGQTVNRAQPLLTLLDCNEIWVEVVVSAMMLPRLTLMLL
ncbi:MAG: HlyD family secretion protein [Leptolyngbyaceae cyanobacterium CRU_2_3]|nr:HlyD family secretion protein [Leptolyngbyaceae cyanobacterium CRU_2_3]